MFGNSSSGSSGGGGGGGSAPSVKEKEVNFYDYDGTLLHSYTVEEAQALSELPELPEQEGLICQGWNWTLEDLKAENSCVDVGAMYITDDGKTRLYITIDDPIRMDVPLHFKQTVADGVVVDWGDGSPTETVNSTGSKTLTHSYQSVGDYVISLEVVSGELQLGHGTISKGVIGVSDTNAQKLFVYRYMLTKIELGNGVLDLASYSTSGATNVKSITIPQTVKTVQANALSGSNMKFIVFPSGLQFGSNASKVGGYEGLVGVSLPHGLKSLPNGCFDSNINLKRICIPNSVTSFGTIGVYGSSSYFSIEMIKLPSGITTIENNALKNMNKLKSLIIPDTVKSIGSYAFQNCNRLKEIKIPEDVTSIGNYAFNQCHSITKFDIPKGVTTIGQGVFTFCGSVKYYNFTKHTTVPTLENTNAFNSQADDFEIRVPAALVDEWKAATNWSTYADKIVGV